MWKWSTRSKRLSPATKQHDWRSSKSASPGGRPICLRMTLEAFYCCCSDISSLLLGRPGLQPWHFGAKRTRALAPGVCFPFGSHDTIYGNALKRHQLHTQPLKVLPVERRQLQSVEYRRSRDQRVCKFGCMTSLLRYGNQSSALVGHLFSDRQYPSLEGCQHSSCQPEAKLILTFA